MKTKWTLDQEAFDNLLEFLNADRDRAGEKYEEIRRKLIKFYLRRGCPLAIAEDLTDEVMNRVGRKAREIAPTYVGDPALYCYAFAQNVYLEYVKKRWDPRPMPPPEPPDEQKERYSQCLEDCMEGLDDETRLLIVSYYRETKQAKIDYRKELADQRGLSPNTLRMRILRIKTNLRVCVEECVRQGDPNLDGDVLVRSSIS